MSAHSLALFCSSYHHRYFPSQQQPTCYKISSLQPKTNPNNRNSPKTNSLWANHSTSSPNSTLTNVSVPPIKSSPPPAVKTSRHGKNLSKRYFARSKDHDTSLQDYYPNFNNSMVVMPLLKIINCLHTKNPSGREMVHPKTPAWIWI